MEVTVIKIYSYVEYYDIPIDQDFDKWCIDNNKDPENEESLREYALEVSDGMIPSDKEPEGLVDVSFEITK